MIQKILLLLVGVCIPCFVYCQDVDVNSKALLTSGGMDFGHNKHPDPEMLAKKLLAKASSDQEKFDALFGWVAFHIHYDYGAYYAGGGSGSDDLSAILKRRRAICLGYANLMDSLCRIAGLPSAVVTGYATDELFDVNDPVYGNNHAWNAVKLDGYWYLYDVTWSSGKITMELSPWAQRVERWKQSFKIKYKKKRVGRRYDRLFRAQCDDLAPKSRTKTYYYKQRFFNRLFLLRLMHLRLPLSGRKVYKKQVHTDYYLSDPAVFSLTHFPDDPTWNLGLDKSITDMQSDSGYYYLTDSVLAQQNHSGKICTACDTLASFDAKAKAVWDLSRSRAFNFKNHFPAVSAGYELAMQHWGDRKASTDTAQIRQLNDSVQVYLNSMQTDLVQCRSSEKLSFNQQKLKSLKKQRLLLDGNKQHALLVKKNVKATQSILRRFREMSNKSSAFVHTYEKAAGHIRHVHTRIKVPEKAAVSDKKVAQLEKRLEQRQAKLDSMALQLEEKRALYDTLIYNLWLNVWQQRSVYDSIIKPIAVCTHLRYRGQDNYKKVIVDLRRELDFHERNFDLVIRRSLFEPGDSCVKLFDQIAYLVKWKNAFQNECLGYKRELIKAKALGTDELVRYRDEVLKDRRRDRCWLYEMFPKLNASERGLAFIVVKQYLMRAAIDAENAAERARHSRVVMPELKRRFAQRNAIVAHNQRLVKRLNRKLRAEK